MKIQFIDGADKDVLYSKTFDFLRDNLMIMMKIPQRTIEREISFLRKNNYIEKKGATKNGIWVVLK